MLTQFKLQYLSLKTEKNYYKCELIKPESAQIMALSPKKIPSINKEIISDYKELVKGNIKKKHINKIGDKIGGTFNKIYGSLLEETEDIDNLALILDDETAQVPWEIGVISKKPKKTYLCENTLGRMRVIKSTRWSLFNRRSRRRKALIVGLDYENDEKLECAQSESENIGNLLEAHGFKVTTLLGKKATSKNVKNKLKNYFDIFHFTGHGGLINNEGVIHLHDDKKLRSTEINRLQAPMLSFINACSSSVERIHKTSKWTPYTWANAFLKNGSDIFIGTLWQVNDTPSDKFAEKFYTKMFDQSKTLGEAMKETRKDVKRIDDDCHTWLAYVLYGNPGIKITELLPKPQ